MLQPFSNIMDGYLGPISVTIHRFDLTSGAAPVHSVPFREGAKVREFQFVEISRMIEQEFIELVTTEWDATIVFARKRTVPFASMSISEEGTQ